MKNEEVLEEENLSIEELYEKEINLQDYIYDSFVFNKHNIIVLKNEVLNQSNENQPKENQSITKNIFMANLLQIKGYNILAPLEAEEYNKALEYYLKLKKSFLKE